jgi:hypothetical protein
MKEHNLQDLLVTSGFPRSGNTFVNYAFKKIFDLEMVNTNRHTIVAIQNREHTFVPFRHPLECISSWHLYQEEFLADPRLLENDFKYYLRFHSGLKPLSEKITLLDFDLFKEDLQYLLTKVTDRYEVTPLEVTIGEIKTSMIESNKDINLPRGTQAQKQEIQEWMQELDVYQECVSVYDSLK